MTSFLNLFQGVNSAKANVPKLGFVPYLVSIVISWPPLLGLSALDLRLLSYAYLVFSQA